MHSKTTILHTLCAAIHTASSAYTCIWIKWNKISYTIFRHIAHIKKKMEKKKKLRTIRHWQEKCYYLLKPPTNCLIELAHWLQLTFRSIEFYIIIFFIYRCLYANYDHFSLFQYSQSWFYHVIFFFVQHKTIRFTYFKNVFLLLI